MLGRNLCITNIVNGVLEKKGIVKLSGLDNFMGFLENFTNVNLYRCACAFILYMIGTLLCSNSSGDDVPMVIFNYEKI